MEISNYFLYDYDYVELSIWMKIYFTFYKGNLLKNKNYKIIKLSLLFHKKFFFSNIIIIISSTQFKE